MSHCGPDAAGRGAARAVRWGHFRTDCEVTGMFSIDSTRIFQAGADDAFAPLYGLVRRLAAAMRALTAADEAPERGVPRDLVSREEILFILDDWRKSAA